MVVWSLLPRQTEGSSACRRLPLRGSLTLPSSTTCTMRRVPLASPATRASSSRLNSVSFRQLPGYLSWASLKGTLKERHTCFGVPTRAGPPRKQRRSKKPKQMFERWFSFWFPFATFIHPPNKGHRSRGVQKLETLIFGIRNQRWCSSIGDPLLVG